MNEIFVYVEGASDQLGMRKLLSSVIEDAASRGNKIDFYPLGGKNHLLNKGPKRAVNILLNKPHSWVFLVPDLYPRNEPFKHETFVDLKEELLKRFMSELRVKATDLRIKDKFFVHCFKYDFESLLLASENILLKRLEATKFSVHWKTPVEEQNHNQPPKRIIEELFRKVNKIYKGTIDAPWILERTDHRDLSKKCPQNFKPFLDDLLRLVS